MTKICICFDVHFPLYFRNYKIFEIGKNSNYFDNDKIKNDILNKAKNSFLPMNNLISELISTHSNNFKINFYISGISIELFEKYCPEIITSFRELSEQGSIEFLSGTYHNSSKFLVTNIEYQNQIQRHRTMINRHLNSEVLFRKDELQNLNNFELSSLIENFSDKSSENWPLTSSKFIDLLSNENSEKIVLYLNYDLFGDVISEEDGIFNFTKSLFNKIIDNNNFEFSHPHEFMNYENKIPEDNMSDLENVLVSDFANEFTDLRSLLSTLDNKKLISDLDYLTSQDHINKIEDEPYDYYLNYANVLSDIKRRALDEKISHNVLPSMRKVGNNLREIKDIVL